MLTYIREYGKCLSPPNQEGLPRTIKGTGYCIYLPESKGIVLQVSAHPCNINNLFSFCRFWEVVWFENILTPLCNKSTLR